MDIRIDSRHNGNELHSEQTLPTLLRYSITDRLALDFGFDGFTSQESTDAPVQTTGFGDSTIGAQWVALPQSSIRPAVALAYGAKLPTGTNGVGTGEVDHRLHLLVSKKLGQVEVNGVATYLNVGEEPNMRTSGGSFAVSESQEFSTHIGYVADLSHRTVDAEVPKGTFLLGAVPTGWLMPPTWTRDSEQPCPLVLRRSAWSAAFQWGGKSSPAESIRS